MSGLSRALGGTNSHSCLFHIMLVSICLKNHHRHNVGSATASCYNVCHDPAVRTPSRSLHVHVGMSADCFHRGLSCSSVSLHDSFIFHRLLLAPFHLNCSSMRTMYTDNIFFQAASCKPVELMLLIFPPQSLLACHPPLLYIPPFLFLICSCFFLSVSH